MQMHLPLMWTTALTASLSISTQYPVSSVSGFAFTASPLRTSTIHDSTCQLRSRSSPYNTFLPPPTRNTIPKTHVALNLSNNLDSLSSASTEDCDVLVIGSGPAARALASLLSSSKNNINTILADANYDREWAPNYGVWEDEWQAIAAAYGSNDISKKDLETKCIDTRWAKTDCYFGGSFDIPVTERFRVDRPYLRVDKNALRDTLSPGNSGANYKVVKANHNSKAIGVNMYSPFGSIVHDESGSTIQLETKEGDTISVRTKLIVDATGHETSLIMRDSRSKVKPAGYQIAYGILVEVDESNVPSLNSVGPYDKKAMTLFDYRTDHIPADELDKAEKGPTFMYAMPLGGNKIFFEETSLVARPALSFQECKTRCFQRLEHLGITVTKVEEEEFCYIPMGGPLPSPDQRIIGFGGANAMVHPSTGYNLCRNMMGAVNMAETIVKELSLEENEEKGFNPGKAAAQAYDSIWSPSNIRQRNFAVFGGEFLMQQQVKGLRGFFDGFFRLPIETWGGFLAGWPGLPNNDKHETWSARLWFGLLFVSKLPLEVSFAMLVSIIQTSLWDGGALIQSVTPLLGEPEGYAWETRPRTKDVGDVAAKAEAKEMIQASKVTEDLPVAFGELEEQVVVEDEVEEVAKVDETIEEAIAEVETVEVAEAEEEIVGKDESEEGVEEVIAEAEDGEATEVEEEIEEQTMKVEKENEEEDPQVIVV